MRVEKRRNPRDRVNWTVSIQTQVGTLERVAYNIGPDGSFISGLSSLETQEIVRVISEAFGQWFGSANSMALFDRVNQR
jgi:hypothetical protein